MTAFNRGAIRLIFVRRSQRKRAPPANPTHRVHIYTHTHTHRTRITRVYILSIARGAHILNTIIQRVAAEPVWRYFRKTITATMIALRGTRVTRIRRRRNEFQNERAARACAYLLRSVVDAMAVVGGFQSEHGPCAIIIVPTGRNVRT